MIFLSWMMRVTLDKRLKYYLLIFLKIMSSWFILDIILEDSFFFFEDLFYLRLIFLFVLLHFPIKVDWVVDAGLFIS